MARTGEGKRGGYRTIIVYQKGKRAIFVYGFAKNERENISPDELRELRKAALQYQSLSEKDITTVLEEVNYEKKIQK